MTPVESHRSTGAPRRVDRHRGSRPPEDRVPPAGPRFDRSRPLPSGRAVVGALLMAVAAVGVFAALRTAGEGPSQTIVVAAADLPVGHTITAADLRVERGSLPGPETAAGFDATAAAVGSVTVAPLRAGDVVQRSAVLLPDQAASAGPDREVSFSVDRERALDGSLQRGERVDVLATYGSGDAAFTIVVARDVTLIDVDSGSARSGAIGAGTKLTFTVALAGSDDVLRVAHATQVAAVTLVRTSRAGDTGRGDLDRVGSPTPPDQPGRAADRTPVDDATASRGPTGTSETTETSRPSGPTTATSSISDGSTNDGSTSDPTTDDGSTAGKAGRG
jgi:Flp pilus assembly protein CpaB